MATSAVNAQELKEKHENEEFIPGDNIAQFYIYFGMALIVPYTIALVLRSDPGKLGWFAYHPPALAIALSAVAYSISPLQPARHADTTVQAVDKHATWAGGLAAPLILAGVTAVWKQKEVTERGHWVSWHGTFGGLAAALVVTQVLAGALINGGLVPRKHAKYHRLSGYFLIVLLSLTLSLGGIFSNFASKKSWTATRWIVYGLGPASLAGGVLSRMRTSKLWK